MKLNVQTIQIVGRGKEKCEDVFYRYTQDQKYDSIGLADGQSEKKCCVEGGENVLKVVSEYMEQQNLATLLGGFHDEVQYELIKRIREKLQALAGLQGEEVQEFSSTICSIACNLETGDFVIVHLGDGCIVGVSKENKVWTMSSPENGRRINETYLTTSPVALSHIRLSHGNLNNFKSIYIMTDGVETICRQGYILSAAGELLKQQDFETLSCKLKESNPRDDASIVMIEVL